MNTSFVLITATGWSIGRRSRMRQRGATLLIALLLLVVLLIMAVPGIQNAGLQERVAGNSRDRNLAFNAAESALRDAEGWLFSVPNVPVPESTVTGIYLANQITSLNPTASRQPANAQPDAVSPTLWEDPAAIAFIKSNGLAYGSKTGAAALPDVTIQPRYILEQLPNTPGQPITYRITAAGFGRVGATVVLQSYFTPPQNTVLNP